MNTADLEELRHELRELLADLDEEARDRLPGRIESLVIVAVETLEALQAEAGERVARRWQLVDVDGPQP